jgi:4-hydroxy-3-polyprenylbenzoate decarboxylase
LFIAAREDSPELSTKKISDFFQHILSKVDWSKDLHLITRTTMDTLDYSGISLNQGSKAIIAATGRNKRDLSLKVPAVNWPAGFGKPRIFAPGILILEGPKHCLFRDQSDVQIEALSDYLSNLSQFKDIPLLVITDDSKFAAANWENFLWVTFTRADPATDTYGLNSFTQCKHWGCIETLILDSRLKSYQAPPLEADPEVESKVDELGIPGGPLHKII